MLCINTKQCCTFSENLGGIVAVHLDKLDISLGPVCTALWRYLFINSWPWSKETWLFTATNPNLSFITYFPDRNHLRNNKDINQLWPPEGPLIIGQCWSLTTMLRLVGSVSPLRQYFLFNWQSLINLLSMHDISNKNSHEKLMEWFIFVLW